MRSPVSVCVWYDTEDFLTPADDDATLRLARLHTQYRAPATFKLVAQKARMLQQRGRVDVIGALKRHALGYHTNLHSVPPVVTEYCEALPWSDGVAMFRSLESPGLGETQRILERPMCTFGQAGGAWAPQMYPVLREWGVPTYVDSGPWVGLDGKPFWFMGLLHVFHMGPNETRFSLRDPGAEIDACNQYSNIVERLAATGGGVVSIYFHPNEWVTEEFWDAVNWARGANPRFSELRCPALTPPAEVERRFAAFETYLKHLAEGEAQPVTALDLAEMYRDRARGAYYSPAALVELTADWDGTVGYAQADEGWLSAAEVLTTAAQLLAPDAALAPAAALRLARPLSVDGPITDVLPLGEPLDVPFDDLAAAAAVVVDACQSQDHVIPHSGLVPSERPPRPRRRKLPSAVMVGRVAVRPEEFLGGLIRALRWAVSHGEPPTEVRLTPTRLASAEHVAGPLGRFRWIIFPDGFEAPTVMNHAVRQSWTLKPAAPVPGWQMTAPVEL